MNYETIAVISLIVIICVMIFWSSWDEVKDFIKQMRWLIKEWRKK